MNANFAEIIASARIAELRRDADDARLVALAARKPAVIPDRPIAIRRSLFSFVGLRFGVRTW